MYVEEGLCSRVTAMNMLIYKEIIYLIQLYCI